MKRHFVTLLMLVAALPIPAAFAQTAVRRVAVYDFSDKLVQPEILSVYGSKKDVGAGVATKIIQELVQNPSFEVINRDKIDEIMKEQNLVFSARFTPSDAPKIGKLLNVDAIITGEVEQIHSGKKGMAIRQIPGAPDVVGNFVHGNSQADVTVSIQVVSTETGRIYWADKSTGKASKQDATQVGLFASAGAADSSHPQAPVVDLALDQAADALATKLMAKASALPVRNVTQDARNIPPQASPSGKQSADSTSSGSAKVFTVGKVDGNEVYIRADKNAGLKAGQSVEIQRPSGSMDDGNGGTIQIYKTVETLVITQVDEQYCVAEAQKGLKPLAHENDKVKVIPN